MQGYLARVFDFASRAVLRVGAHQENPTPHRCRKAHRQQIDEAFIITNG
jgi:hypothetical protein